MMATGACLFLFGYTVMQLDLESELVIPDWICTIAVVCLAIGSLLIVIGSAIWLWRFAP